MFNTKVERTAKRLRKEIKGDIDVLSIIKYVSNIGYRIVFFNTLVGDRLIAAYNLKGSAEKAPAFTISGKDKVIFVDGTIHSHEQTYLLLHELGHILLGHIGESSISLRDKPFLEAEANAFVYEVMNPRKRNIASRLTVLFVVAVLGFGGGFTTHGKIPDNVTKDEVIITRSGRAYHREGCMTIKNKDYIFIPRSEAEKLYDPCGVCNP